MRSLRDIEKFIAKAEVHSGPEANRAVLEDLVEELGKPPTEIPTPLRSETRRSIMRSPVTKFAAAAAIIAATLIVISQFGGSLDSVAWADVVERFG